MKKNKKSHNPIICQFTFKNVHRDFKKAKVSLFDDNKENDGIIVSCGSERLFQELCLAKRWMHKLYGIKMFTDGNASIKRANFGILSFCATDKYGVTKTIQYNSTSKQSAYQFQTDILEDFNTVPNKIFSKDTVNDILFNVYPDTSLTIQLFFRP